MNSPGLQRAAPPGPGLSRSIIERVVLILVLSGSFWAIWWSVSRLRANQTHSRQLNQQVSRLTADIDLMRAQWSGSRTQEIARRFGAVRDSLFVGETAVADWSDSVQRESVPLALESHIRLNAGQTATNGAGSITRVQAMIEVQPNLAAKAALPVYHRLVSWSRQFATQPRRIDLLELSVNSASLSAGSALAVVELWTQDPQPAAPASTNAVPTNEVATATPPADPTSALTASAGTPAQPKATP